MRIEVTDRHIMLGVPGEPGSCPVALAMHGAGFRVPEVTAKDVSWATQDGEIREAPVPEDVRRFVKDYDNEELVSAFAFDLEATP